MTEKEVKVGSSESRATFLARLEPIVSPGRLIDIDGAYTFSKYVHRAQKRKEINPDGTQVRYFEHPRRVALILIDVAEVVDPSMVIAALLHDTVEDSDTLSPAAIERFWGSDVAQLVKLLSKIPAEGYVERLQKYGDWKVILIKACDRLDNVRSLRLEYVSAGFRERQIKETKEKYYPLFKHMLDNLVPEIYLSGAQKVVSEIIQLCEADV